MPKPIKPPIGKVVCGTCAGAAWIKKDNKGRLYGYCTKESGGRGCGKFCELDPEYLLQYGKFFDEQEQEDIQEGPPARPPEGGPDPDQVGGGLSLLSGSVRKANDQEREPGPEPKAADPAPAPEPEPEPDPDDDDTSDEEGRGIGLGFLS